MSRATQDTATGNTRCAYGALTLCGRAVRRVPLARVPPTARSYNPGAASTAPVWAAPRSLATTGGIIRLFSFPAGTEMFQFPAYALRNQAECRGFTPAGCPIRRPADQRPFAPTRGLSQLTTSFIACESQGIPRAPFLSFPARAPGAAAFRAA